MAAVDRVVVIADSIDNVHFTFTCPFCWSSYKKDGTPRANARHIKHFHGSNNDLSHRREYRAPHCSSSFFRTASPPLRSTSLLPPRALILSCRSHPHSSFFYFVLCFARSVVFYFYLFISGLYLECINAQLPTMYCTTCLIILFSSSFFFFFFLLLFSSSFFFFLLLFYFADFALTC
eukprot:TRINITY_DN1896_c0_g1_i7.p1 TRINITY_DN1896_c0_g1~~TRINITY_DN1896_c0_g1_i7.p1  ORF type:complete len:177 (-),score=10.66 TRINITY_DN1896_c0_g1_i7:1-531(-)